MRPQFILGVLLLIIATGVSTRPIKYKSFRDFIDIYRIDLFGSKLTITRNLTNVIQTLPFESEVKDFDIYCDRYHCYLVTVGKNLELYEWRRTQFDLVSKRDTFAQPFAVKLIKIDLEFYIIVAQEQLHLRPRQPNESKFVGNAVLKFTKDTAKNIKYHQFIRLPFNPLHIDYFRSVSTNDVAPSLSRSPNEYHYIVFSIEKNWKVSDSRSYLWSPLDKNFWPYRMPRGVEVERRPAEDQYLKFPPVQLNNQTKPTDLYIAIESCFHQLQRLLADRATHAQRLIESSRSLWRARGPRQDSRLTDIKSQVIVHGNVIVGGSFVEGPKISLVGYAPSNQTEHILQTVREHSPSIIDNKLTLANMNLRYMNDKLMRAVPAFGFNQSLFNGPIKFYGELQADNVTFIGEGLSNSNVMLNGIVFYQLEHDLLSPLHGQDIPAKVIFNRKVHADKLEIRGLVNGKHFLADAVDITSNQFQLIDTDIASPIVGQPSANRFISFQSVSVKEVLLDTRATINDILLGDFITHDERPQQIVGRKYFQFLSIGQLDMAHLNVLLNGFNISRIARNAIRSTGKQVQFLSGIQKFTRPITVRKLVFGGSINGHINMTSLIADSLKTDDRNVQYVSGPKYFLEGVKVASLKTDGAINGVQVDKIFNLSPYPPTNDFDSYINPTKFFQQKPMDGHLKVYGPVSVRANMIVDYLNGVDIGKRAVRRVPASNYKPFNKDTPQIVRGKKIFYRPLRVLDNIRLLDSQQVASLHQRKVSVDRPLVNGFDIKSINSAIVKLREHPPMIYIDNLDIDGNLYIDTNLNQSRTTLGNGTFCPIDEISRKVILAGDVDQIIDGKIRIDTLRAHSANFEAGALNNMNFPDDFVLKSLPDALSHGPPHIEPVFGHKSFDHVSIAPPMILFGSKDVSQASVVFGHQSSINNITYDALKTFVSNERLRNSTGETVVQTLNLYGNIRARRINGHVWPDDIILKSSSINTDRQPLHAIHGRIYSPLVFTESSFVGVRNHLMLRGPIQLYGKMNGANLTELAHNSVTYGDKDLYSSNRPIKNKHFVGGLTVNGEIRTSGRIDGINFEEMKARVVTINPGLRKTHITSNKIFLSDVSFLSALNMMYLNELPIDRYLNLIRMSPDNEITILPKKTVTGALRINGNLLVKGSINKIDFVDLQAKAISLSPESDEIKFNKTLTIEGDVYMDNLLIDERDGIIDGIKLINLLPVDTFTKNEVVLSSPKLEFEGVQPYVTVNLDGSILDCKISCRLSRQKDINVQPSQQTNRQPQVVSYPTNINHQPRHLNRGNNNFTQFQSTPPYVSQPIFDLNPLPPKSHIRADPSKAFQHLATRRPASITYERPHLVKRRAEYGMHPIMIEQINALRKHIVSLNLIKISHLSDIVLGFIDSPSNDVASLRFRDEEYPHYEHMPSQKSFMVLDQIDYPFRPTTYHLSVGVYTNIEGQNVTNVLSSVGGSELRLMSVLPLEYPNSAKFFIADRHTLFLLVSQDYSIFTNLHHPSAKCPSYRSPPVTYCNDVKISDYQFTEGIHVYIFHSLTNSSSLTSAYFDLYQTIGLPDPIDSFDHFDFRGSTYVLALSRPAEKIYLLLLRGYSGFQIVSDIIAPKIESVKVVFSDDQEPKLLVKQSNGIHRLMDPVIT